MSASIENTNNVHLVSDHKYHIHTLKEEILNSCSHLIGMVFSIAALVLLIIQSSLYGSATNVVACTIFGSSLVLMYTTSGLYHGVSNLKAKMVLRKLDHMNIYFLIAGTYTPIALIALNGVYGWIIFGIMWGLTVLGLLYKLFAFNSSWFSTILYVLMGWIALAFIVQIINALPLTCLMLIILGGMFYTSGVVFYMLDTTIKYCHFIWHIFVLLGSISQFFAIYLYLAGMVIK